jgi:hypothetical protein
MHSQLPRSAALVTLIFLENSCDEPFLEFSDRFGIKNVALIHLVYECFQLIFHRISLSVLFKRPDYKSFISLDAAWRLARALNNPVLDKIATAAATERPKLPPVLLPENTAPVTILAATASSARRP